MNIISDKEDLRERGYIESVEIDEYKALSKEQLLTMLSDDNAVKCSNALYVEEAKRGLRIMKSPLLDD